MLDSGREGGWRENQNPPELRHSNLTFGSYSSSATHISYTTINLASVVSGRQNYRAVDSLRQLSASGYMIMIRPQACVPAYLGLGEDY
jgi:hypothetical protein